MDDYCFFDMTEAPFEIHVFVFPKLAGNPFLLNFNSHRKSSFHSIRIVETNILIVDVYVSADGNSGLLRLRHVELGSLHAII